MIQRLIDANILEDEFGCSDRDIYAKEYIREAQTVLIIPENPTNGDMIMALFPYGSYGTNGNEVHVFGVGGNGILVFTNNWWNTPYFKGK